MLVEEARKDERFKFEDGEWWYYPPNSHRARAVTGTCKWCGGDFVRTKSGGRSYDYCGDECYRAWRLDNRTVSCAHCGAEFLREDRGHKFCSHDCYTASNTGENHVHFNGYRTTSHGGYEYFSRSHPVWPGRAVHNVLWHKNNSDKSCEKCGEREVRHIHHRDHDPSNNDLDNLAGLCVRCHIRHHLSHNPDHRVG